MSFKHLVCKSTKELTEELNKLSEKYHKVSVVHIEKGQDANYIHKLFCIVECDEIFVPYTTWYGEVDEM